jgi:CheY-like chemotaxis protein
MPDQQPVNIVMVEDDEGHARLIEKNIRRAGISNTIHHFLDGNSALAFLFDAADGPVRNGPALVLLDLNLPDMSGTDILAKLKADDSPLRRTPVVVLTTTDDKVEIQRCYDLGCNVTSPSRSITKISRMPSANWGCSCRSSRFPILN